MSDDEPSGGATTAVTGEPVPPKRIVLVVFAALAIYDAYVRYIVAKGHQSAALKRRSLPRCRGGSPRAFRAWPLAWPDRAASAW